MTATTDALHRDGVFLKGDLFTVDPNLYPAACHGVVYRVEERPGGRRVNYQGRPVAKNHDTGEWDPTSGRLVSAKGENMRHVDPATEPAPYSGGTRIVEEVPLVALPDIGALVRVWPAHGKLPAGFYSVTGYPQRSTTAVRLVKLGGDGGRYWPKVPVEWLTVLDPSDVEVVLCDALTAGKISTTGGE